jgi:hypothetical protein
MRRALLAVWIAAFAWAPAARAADWQELKGDHFIVYYEGEEAFARQVMTNAESYYTRIADELGYPRYSDFWSWDNRAKVYIYPSAKLYREATGEADWSHGVAVYSKKEIHTFQESEGFLDGILPHEITHLIFRDFIGFRAQAPVWIDEGVAQWEEPAKRAIARKVARWLIHTDKDMALQDLTAADPHKMKDTDQVQYFYMQSVSLVDFLIRTYGAGAFTDFCRALRDGKGFDEALQSSFKVQNQWELQEKWRKEVMGEPVPDDIEVYIRH